MKAAVWYAQRDVRVEDVPEPPSPPAGQVKIKTARMLDGQKNFTGTLLGVSNEIINVSLDNRVVAIPFKEIIKARLVG